MITVYEDRSTRIASLENSGTDRITLCFTGVGHSLGRIDVQREEFVKASLGSTAIFITDKFRSWGNSLNFELIADIVRSYGSGKTINAIGSSMGGFLSIIASRYIGMDNVISFVPQYSVHKDIVPNERRWGHYTCNIREWKYLSLDGNFVEGTNYYILAGCGGADDKQIKLIPSAPNIQKIYFKDRRFSHRVAAILKEEGVLYDVIHDCLMGLSAADIIKSHLSHSAHGAFSPTD